MDVTVDRLRLLRAGAGLAALGALALTACAPDDDTAAFDDSEPASAEDEAEDSADEEEQEGEPESDADGEDDDAQDDDAEGEGQGSEGAEAQTAEGPVDPEDAIATVEYSIVASDIDGTMTLGLHYLQVKDNTMELMLTFTPEFDQDTRENLYGFHGNNGGLARPMLVDRENLKQYSPLMGPSNESWSTDVVGPRVSSGETIVYWANFAVPEDEIDSINVGIPAAPEFEDVEIDWADSEPADYDEDDVEDEVVDEDDIDVDEGDE